MVHTLVYDTALSNFLSYHSCGWIMFLTQGLRPVCMMVRMHTYTVFESLLERASNSLAVTSCKVVEARPSMIDLGLNKYVAFRTLCKSKGVMAWSKRTLCTMSTGTPPVGVTANAWLGIEHKTVTVDHHVLVQLRILS